MTLNYKHLAFFLFVFTGSVAQVGIGTTTPQGAFDVESTNSGVVIPRVALTSRTDVATVINPQGGNVVNGTLVWNTATAGVAPNNVTPGFYYYTHPTWTALGGDTTRQWSLSGNAGTVPGTDYLGTSDAVDLRIRTNNTDRFTFSNTGSLRSHYLGAAATPAYSFNADTNTGIFSPGADQIGFSTNSTERLRIPNANQVHAMNIGSATAPFYSFSADSNTGMYSTGADALAFATNGTQRMRLLNNGQIVINNTAAPSPSDQFSVNSTISAINGYTNNSTEVGVFGYNSHTAGTGIVGSGQAGPGTFLIAGSGGAFSGTSTGLFSYYTSSGTGRTILTQSAFMEQWQVGAFNAATGVLYKIIGDGTVSTIVKDLEDRNVVMHAAESPGVLFEDYGVGSLVNGKAHITIDPILTKNIVVNEQHPLKVFIQLEGECNGVYVTNKTAQSFDVIELQGGSSNTPFSYSIVATRANETHVSEDGRIRVINYGARFEPAPEFEKINQRENQK